MFRIERQSSAVVLHRPRAPILTGKLRQLTQQSSTKEICLLVELRRNKFESKGVDKGHERHFRTMLAMSLVARFASLATSEMDGEGDFGHRHKIVSCSFGFVLKPPES
jgi:hypothetical protein